ncbi:transposase [Gluconobacter oxydans]|nr:transposase [Gluconobacter oxydans]
MSTMQSVISDDAWQVWEPLIEAVRPKGKTPPRDLRRTISAIFWRHQNGSKWRSVPSDLGMVFLDGTNIRAHHKAGGAAKKGDSEAAEAIVKHLVAHGEALAARSVSL